MSVGRRIDDNDLREPLWTLRPKDADNAAAVRSDASTWRLSRLLALVEARRGLKDAMAVLQERGRERYAVDWLRGRRRELGEEIVREARRLSAEDAERRSADSETEGGRA